MRGSSGDRAPRRGGQERSVPRAAGGARGGEGRDPGRRRPPPILLVPPPAVPPCPCRASRRTWLRGEVRETARREPLPCRREGGGPLPRRALQRRSGIGVCTARVAAGVAALPAVLGGGCVASPSVTVCRLPRAAGREGALGPPPGPLVAARPCAPPGWLLLSSGTAPLAVSGLKKSA